MIKVFKLTTKETVMGELESPIQAGEPILLYDPMVIEVYENEYGDMMLRLRSAISLSEDDYLPFEYKHILTHYTPLSMLEEYYNKIRVELKSGKEFINDIIKDAIKELETEIQVGKNKNMH